jgi:hypothetical protein
MMCRAIHPQSLAWCETLLGMHRAGGDAPAAPAAPAAETEREVDPAALGMLTTALGKVMEVVKADSSSLPEEAPCGEAREWARARYTQVDERLAAVTNLAMMVPVCLASGGAEDSGAAADRQTAEALVRAVAKRFAPCSETAALPGSKYNVAYEHFKKVGYV